MAWSRIAGASAGSADSNAATTAGIDTTGATLLVAFAAWDTAAGALVFTDSKGNAWNKLTSRVNTVEGSFWWCVPTSVGSGHTFTGTRTGSNPSVSVEAWAGADPAPFDQETGATGTSGATLATGSVTPTKDKELLFAGLAARGGSGAIVSIDGGFTIGSSHTADATSDTSGIAYLTQTAAAAANPTWTVTNIDSVKAAAIATFKIKIGAHRMFAVL